MKNDVNDELSEGWNNLAHMRKHGCVLVSW